LYNYDARLYDPVIGRFVTPDIAYLNIFEIVEPNRYSYCKNSPLIYVDPEGLWSVSVEGSFGIGPLGISIGLTNASNGLFGSISVGPGAGCALTATIDPIGEPEAGTTIDGSVQGGNGVVGAKGTVGISNEGKGSSSIGVGWGIGGYSRQGALTTTVDLSEAFGQILGFLGFSSENNNANTDNDSDESNNSTGDENTLTSENDNSDAWGYW
jgi:hypothetical protein